jgi:predicted aspartyl protease
MCSKPGIEARSFRASAFGSFCLLAWLCVAGVARAGCTAAHVASVPFTEERGYIYIPVTMNGATGSFLVDTGSAGTVVDSGFAARAGIGMDRHAGRYVIRGAGNKETLPSFQGHVRMTEIGALRYQDWEYIIVDLSFMAHDGVRRDGVLGMDFLHYFDMDIDFADHSLTLYRLSGCSEMSPLHWKGDYDSIPLKHTPSQNLTMPIYVDNALLNMELDTGAGRLLLSRDAAEKAGVTQDALAHDLARHGEGFGGSFNTAYHRFGTFLVGSAVHKNALLAVANETSGRGETDGLIGLGALKAARLWISYATSTLFLQRESQVK